MKPSLSIKTLYRSPVRTILTFVLIAVVTFALFSQTAEYAITVREMASAARQYTGVGAAEIMPLPDNMQGVAMPSILRLKDGRYIINTRYEPLAREQMSAIAGLPYVTSTDERYMTAGVSDTYYRPDDGGYFYNYTARCVIEGTLEEIRYGEPTGDSGASFIGLHHNRLIIGDCALIAGNLPWAVAGEQITIFSDPGTYGDNAIILGGGWPLSGGGTRAVFVLDGSYKWGTEYIETLAPGGRYTFVLRFEPLDETVQVQGHYLGDYLSDPWCDAIWPLDGVPENYMETDEFAPLRELVELINADLHTFDMVYTDDMGAIMRFAEGKMAIADGRGLTPEDSAYESKLCVVSRDFAEANGLGVGDTLTIKLGTELFEQSKGLGAVAGTRERYKPAEKAVTLEIAGVYTDTDGVAAQSREPNWSYSTGTIFVPKSLLPVDEAQLAGHEFTPSEFSFKVENAWDIPAFIEEIAPEFEKMGLTLIFIDDGWSDIANGFRSTQRLSLIRIAALAAAAAAAICFTVYLFIGRKKKEYAVMRALGTPRRRSARALTIPLMAMAAVAVAFGGVAAWIYTARTVAGNETLAMLGEHPTNTSIPAGVAAGCILGEIMFTLAIASAILRRIGALAPLALLQDNSGGKRTRSGKKAALPEPPSIHKAEIAAVVPSEVFSARSYMRNGSSPRFILRYVLRHAQRAARKSALAFLLAALFLGVVGQFALMMWSYTDLCESTTVTANFAGGINLYAVPQLERTGYVTQPYYVAEDRVGVNADETHVVITNNIARYTGEEPEIIYAEGYDASCMDNPGNIIIIGDERAALVGLAPGDTVEIIIPYGLLFRVREYIYNYKTNYPEETLSDNELLSLHRDAIMRTLGMRMDKFTVAGVVSTPSGKYGHSAFSPGSNNLVGGLSNATRLDVAEFTLADYRLAKELRDYGEKLATSAGNVRFTMDTGKLDNLVNTLNLLRALYPIAVAAALLIGGFLCSLVILQSSRDAAIMRVLGTTKRKTRAILAFEQTLLCVAGLALGACALLMYNGAALAPAAGSAAVFAALYFAVIVIAAVVSSAAATHRSALDLLQTKE
jgi:ABC-type lipoprotein release transport system permease subunit